jgi:DNA-binding HxlR family transcriptional regulator
MSKRIDMGGVFGVLCTDPDGSSISANAAKTHEVPRMPGREMPRGMSNETKTNDDKKDVGHQDNNALTSDLSAEIADILEKTSFLGVKELSISRDLKRLDGKDQLLIIKSLLAGPKAVGDLKTATGIESSRFNHILMEMKTAGLIVKKDKCYYLTKYGVALMEGLAYIRKTISDVSGDELLLPASSK